MPAVPGAKSIVNQARRLQRSTVGAAGAATSALGHLTSHIHLPLQWRRKGGSKDGTVSDRKQEQAAGAQHATLQLLARLIPLLKAADEQV